MIYGDYFLQRSVEMDISVKSEQRTLVLNLKGELDHHGAVGSLGRIQREIEVHLPILLVLDFSNITFMDSSGIAVVMKSRQRMQELGGQVKLRSLAPQAKKVFDAAGISRMVEIV